MKTRTCFAASMALLLLMCAVLGGQEEKKVERNVVIQRSVTAGPGMASTFTVEGPFGPGMGDRVMFVSSEMAFDNKLVKGAPYQAQAVSEHVQVLADGNRISRRDSASVYRDSEGRTRREQNIAAIGPWAPAGERLRTIFIIDPVADASYILDPETRTARKTFAAKMRARDKELEAKIEELRKQHPGERVRVELRNGVESVEVLKAEEASPARAAAEKAHKIAMAAPNARTEQLGRQIIEGVEAEGTRTVFTIAAGEIGNERPIEIVSESWFSPDLQVVVMSRHSDPRIGEDNYRLTNIQRIEPPATLFQVPADYTIKEGNEPAVMRYKMEKLEKK